MTSRHQRRHPAGGSTLHAGLKIAAVVGAGAWIASRAAKAGSDGNENDWELTGRSVTIAKPRQQLYEYWRDFGNLAGFMENVVAVQRIDDATSRWTIRAPAGRTVSLVTEVVEDRPGECIAWRSTAQSDIVTEGAITFADAPGERGTRVTATIAYDPPGGELGKLIAKLFLREPAIQARHDLKRFKMLMETGEIATSARRSENTRAAKYNENKMHKENA